MRKSSKKGFTLVELVIVIAVVAILAGILIPTFSGTIGEAEDAALKTDAKSAYSQYIDEVAAGAEPECAEDQDLFIVVADSKENDVYFKLDGTKLVPAAATDVAVGDLVYKNGTATPKT